MSLVGETFIRVRPDTHGFKAEAESQVKSSLSGIGKIVLEALAIREVFSFGKEIASQAAVAQTAAGSVRAEFGAAADEILRFGHESGAALGLSAVESIKASAGFGQLAANLDIGAETAAKMDLNLQRTAGSLSTIKGTDAAQTFDALRAAIGGSLRGLRPLGIVIDQTQVKVAAWKLGLTSTINEALTPGERALATYALVTAHLGDLQQQAAGHAHDFTAVQERLRAEWANAKDELGTKLLPVLTQFGLYLAGHLPGAVDKVSAKLASWRDTLNEIPGPINGVKGAVEGLVAAFAIYKIARFAAAIRTDLIANGMVKLKAETLATKTAYLESMGAMRIATIGLAATVKSALISTVFGAIIVAAGFAAEYVITHWDKVKGWFVTAASYMGRAFDTTWEAIQQGAKAAAYGILSDFTLVLRTVLGLASHLPFVGHYARDALNAIQGEIDRFKPDFSKVADAWSQGGTEAGLAFVQAARAQIADQVSNFGGTLPGLSALEGHPVNDAISGAFTGANNPVAAAADAAAAATQKAVATLNDKLQTTVKTNTAAISKARASLSDARQSLADAIRQQGADVAQAVSDAKANLVSLGTGLASTIGTFIDNGPLGKQIKALQDALSGRQQTEQRKQLVQAIADAKKQLRESQAAVDTGGAVTPDIARGIKEFLAPSEQGLSQAQVALTDFDAQQRINSLQGRAQALKDSISRGIADLTDAFNRHGLSPQQFNDRVSSLLARGGINYKNAGKTLGTSFADGFRDQVTTLLQQAFAIDAGPQLAGISGTVIRPLEVLRKDQNDVAKAQREVALKQAGYQDRIAKATEQQVAILKKITAVQLGPTANDVRPAPTKPRPRK